MSWQRRLALLVLAWLALSRPAACAGPARPEMLWLLTNFAPASMLNEGRPGEGIGDRIAAYLASGMPEYEHRYSAPSSRRLWAMIEDGRHRACHVTGVITPERRKLAYFTTVMMAPPHQLIVRSALLPQLPRGTSGDVDLAALMRDDGLRGIVTNMRSYGAPLDAAIAARPPKANLLLANPGTDGGSLLRMVALGRADYTLEYDFVFGYLLTRSQELSGLRALPVQGNAALVPVGIACPRNAWGRDMIERIDGLLATPAGVDAVRKAVAAWLSPDTAARYRDDMERFYRARLQRTPPDRF